MKFEISEFNRNVEDSELLLDLKSVYEKLESSNEKITFRKYNELGKFAAQTLAVRFGSWNQALEKAGINITDQKNIPLISLFENLELVWRTKGKQPTTRDMKSEPSKYSDSAYILRFGTWRKSVESFINYVESNEEVDSGNIVQANVITQTPRSINLRLRFKVLARDFFTCQSCGASPSKDPNVELHVDHVIPWSLGGETVESNLKTKCKSCNLGKSNAFNV